MFRDVDYFLNELQKDTTLYNIFYFIAKYSTVYDEMNVLDTKEVKLYEVISGIKNKVVDKSDDIIQSYIDILIGYGLFKYIIPHNKIEYMDDNSTDKNDEKRLEYFKNLGYPNENAKIILTNKVTGCSGKKLFDNILQNKHYEKLGEQYEEDFKLSVEKIIKPYDEKIESLNKELEVKMHEINRTLDNGIIKNIQVLSIFAGIISLLFANLMGIKEFSNIGINGLLILNYSIIIAILSLLFFTKLLIVGGKIEYKSIFFTLLIIFFIAIPIILFWIIV